MQAQPQSAEHRRVLQSVAVRLIADGHSPEMALRMAYESLIRVTLKQRGNLK